MGANAAEPDSWLCRRIEVSSPFAGGDTLFADVDSTWRSLQPLQSSARAPYPSGWARISWCAAFLHYDVVLDGAGARNRARRLNERTWELGEVCEIFLRRADEHEYLELHVTPENQRLQLLFPAGAIERVRAGQARLDDHVVSRPDWVESATHVAATRWRALVRIPAACLRLERFDSAVKLRTAVCRYDCTQGPAPILSATARFGAGGFHRREAWTPLRLATEPAR